MYTNISEDNAARSFVVEVQGEEIVDINTGRI
jgi:hypothetical protein